MRKLNTLESRILSTLKKHDESIDVESIMSSTLLPRFAVEHVLDCLKQEGMTPRIYDSHPDPSVVQIVVTKPSVSDPMQWIDDFLEECPPVPGQNANGRYSGHGLVILAVLLTDSEDPGQIAGLTTLPLHFVMLMLVLAAAHNMWGSHQVIALSSAVEENDLSAIEAALAAVEMQFWNLCGDSEVRIVALQHQQS